MSNIVQRTVEIFDCDQNSEEWDANRLGVITASGFSKVLSGGKGLVRTKYLRTLAGERMTGAKEEGYKNDHMERGHDLEDAAVEAYETKTGNKTEKVGFCKNFGFGASPDRFVGNDGLLEMKTAIPSIQIERLEDNKLPSIHKAQVQGQLWIAERKWCDFVSYSSLLLPILIVRVERDEEYISKLKEACQIAEIDIKKMITKINGMW